MPHPLEQKIAALRRRAQRLATIYGSSAAAATFLVAIFMLGTIAAVFRVEDRGLRVMSLLTILGVLAWAIRRYVVPVWSHRPSDVDLARRVQRRFPSLGDRLASAVEFLAVAQNDPTAGSPTLRQAVVSQVFAEVEPIDFTEVLDPRPTIRAAVLLLTIGLLGGALMSLDPTLSEIAVSRLINPLNDHPWPQKTNLVFRPSADGVPRGQTFQIEVADARNMPLPSDVFIHYRTTGPDNAVIEQTERLHDRNGQRTARRENVLQPFSFRVEGGDDRSMPWHDVRVVDPPAITSLAIRLIPPTYTGAAPTMSERPIRAVIGTKVQLSGTSSAPLQSAMLSVNEQVPLPARLSDDGRAFSVEFTIERSGSYGLRLTDHDGVASDEQRWEIRAIADAPPTVAIERPSGDHYATPTAVVPLRITARDDLGLKHIAIEYFSFLEKQDAASEGSGEPVKETKGQVSLWDAPPNLTRAETPTSRVADDRWDLTALGFHPGMNVMVHAIAWDTKGQSSASRSRRLIVVTPDELQQRLVALEAAMVAELQRASEIEQNSRSQIESIRSPQNENPKTAESHFDRLQVATQNQQDVHQILSQAADSVVSLLADLENNHLQSDALRRQMAVVAAEVDRIHREHLPTIADALATAMKSMQIEAQPDRQPPPLRPAVADALADASTHQKAVIDRLNALLQRLAASADDRRVVQKLLQVIRDQEGVAKRTAEVGRRTLAQELPDLSTVDRSALNAIADAQRDVARDFDRLAQQMDEAVASLRTRDPISARRMADVLDEARRRTIDRQMSTVGRQIDQNQIGRAIAGERQIAQDLQTMFARLTQSAQPSAASSTKTAASPPSQEKPTTQTGQPSDQQPGRAPSTTTTVTSPRGAKPIVSAADAARSALSRIWGQLPERDRQRIMQQPTENFVPKYRQQTEAYYRRLADETSKDQHP